MDLKHVVGVGARTFTTLSVLSEYPREPGHVADLFLKVIKDTRPVSSAITACCRIEFTQVWWFGYKCLRPARGKALRTACRVQLTIRLERMHPRRVSTEFESQYRLYRLTLLKEIQERLRYREVEGI